MKSHPLEECNHCRYWEPTSDGIRGWCRRHAPMAFVGKRNGDAIWPMTSGLEWCGDWKLKT